MLLNRISRTWLFLFFIGVFPIKIWAQDPTNYIKTDLIPASPNAASIGKFGEIPMNLSTGSSSFSIPIFTLEGNSLSLPISLSYSYDGFRPSQQSSWVGLGWNLNAGGVISRNVKGLVDNMLGPGSNYQDEAVHNLMHTITIDQEFLHAVAQGSKDTEPDIYSFNFGSYSGKFIHFKNKFYCFPQERFKITGTDDSGFSITTEDGVKYDFTEIETTSPKGSSESNYTLPTYISSWYLSKITNPAGTEFIFLNYTSEGTIEQHGTLTQTYKKLIGGVTMPTASEQSVLFPIKRTFPTRVNTLRLSSIVTEKYVVNFIVGDARLDLSPSAYMNAKTLSSIQVTSNTEYGVNDVKEVALNLSYWGNISKYLRLDSVVFKSFNNTELPMARLSQSYAFEYEPIGDVERTYARLDHYGFFNGGSFQSVLLPSMYYNSGPNREPVLEWAKAGALKKITYPTKGSSSFEYEQNRKYTDNSNQTTSGAVVVSMTRPSDDPSSTLQSAYSNGTFTLSHSQTVSVYVTRGVKIANSDDQAKNTSDDFKLVKVIDGDAFTLVGVGKINYESDNGGKEFTFTLPAGDYILVAVIDAKENSMAVSVNYQIMSNTPNAGAVAGGIRIRQVTDNPVIGNVVTHTYDYTNEAGFSSGKSMITPYDISQFVQRKAYEGNPLAYYDLTYEIYNSSIAENYYVGVPHFYTSVLESVTDGISKTSTRTNFLQLTQYMMGIEPVSVIQYKTDANNQLIPLTKKEYNYGLKQDTIFRGIRPRKVMDGTGVGSLPYIYEWDDYSYTQGRKYLETLRTVSYEGTDSLVSVTNNSYDLAGSPSTYNLLMSTSEGSRGDKIITKYKYPESYSSSISAAYLNANVLSPVFEQQKWRKSGLDSVLIAATVTTYNSSLFKPVKIHSLDVQDIHSLNNEGMSETKYTSLFSDSRFAERVNYSYDTNGTGRIVGQQLVNGPATSYKWAYKSVMQFPSVGNALNYVVASCTNALAYEFYTENFEEDNTAASETAAHTGYRFHNGSYSVNWALPNGRAYQIAYWYLDGTWKYKSEAYPGGTVTLSGGSAYDDIVIAPVDAQVFTYTYLPGIGISTIIDSKGQTTYYEYDDFHRLKAVKDQNGNILKQTDYHFKN